MKKAVLKHDLEFFIMLFVFSLVFAALDFYDFESVLSISTIAILFMGYILYSGYQLLYI